MDSESTFAFPRVSFGPDVPIFLFNPLENVTTSRQSVISAATDEEPPLSPASVATVESQPASITRSCSPSPTLDVLERFPTPQPLQQSRQPTISPEPAVLVPPRDSLRTLDELERFPTPQPQQQSRQPTRSPEPVVLLLPQEPQQSRLTTRSPEPAVLQPREYQQSRRPTRSPEPAVLTLREPQQRRPPTRSPEPAIVPPRDPLRIKKKPVPQRKPVPPNSPQPESPHINSPQVQSPQTPGADVELNIPTHPISSMQHAFAESLLEVTAGTATDKPKLRDLDVKQRHQALLDKAKDAEPLNMRWRFRPGQTQHELIKLMAQISFGVYLLLKGMANSDAQVVTILQGHIDELDEFLELTLEDFDYTAKDLQDRIDLLRIPTENIEVFEKMLEERNFRAEIVEGNEVIEHVLARTTVALQQYEKDVEVGLRCTQEFGTYLREQNEDRWRDERREVAEIYGAMKCNTDGWFNAFRDLQARGKNLNNLVTQLTATVAMMDKKAGEVSRRTWASIPPFTLPIANSPPSSPPGSRWSQSQSSHGHMKRRSVSLSGGTPSTITTTYFELPARDTIHSIDEDSDLSTPKPQISTGSTTPEGGSDTEQEQEQEQKPNETFVVEVPPAEIEPLYILQPRTYTPQPPAPLPSPMVRDAPPAAWRSSGAETSVQKKRTSLRQRVSLKNNLPGSIQIPPPNMGALQRTHQPPDSAYGSGVEPRIRTSSVSHFGSDADQRLRLSTSTAASSIEGHRARSSSSTMSDLSPPIRGTQPIPSPLSDQQYYRPLRPVQASPHSPLQQRPQTAGASPRAPFSPALANHPGHVRNAPSRLGGASMLSNVTTVTYDTQADGEKRLKKKKSAFGWLKKAFSLDEEERAAFEARKQATHRNPYFEPDPTAPRFLDGKRIK